MKRRIRDIDHWAVTEHFRKQETPSGGAIFDTAHGKIQRTFFEALALAFTTLAGLPTPAEIGDPTDMGTRNTIFEMDAIVRVRVGG